METYRNLEIGNGAAGEYMNNIAEKEPLLREEEDRHRDISAPCPNAKLGKQQSSKGTKWAVIVLGLLAAVSALCVVNDSEGTPLRYHLLNYYDELFGGYGGENPTFACSGHGVKVYGDKCLCDVGFVGQDCGDERSSEIASTEQATICLVLESFGSLGSSIDSIGHANSELTLQLTKSGYAVTVLYTGEENPQFSSVASIYSKKGVSVMRLPQSGLEFGDNSIEAKSYSVYQYLIHSSTPKFSHVYFSSDSGSGYYTLLAQSQGLLCSSTVYINGIDSLPVQAAARINADDKAFMVTDKNTLKLDFFMQKSAELADLNILSSSLIFDHLIASKWNMTRESTHVVNKPAPKTSITKHITNEAPINELVFIGPLTHAGGLKIFCDAIDAVIPAMQTARAKITFLGTAGMINDMKSEEYVELRSLNWDAFEITWNVRVTEDLEEIAQYMNEKSGRMAVLPAMSDPVGALAQALAQAKIPMLVSAQSAVKEVLGVSDRTQMVVDADSESFAAKLKSILNGLESAPSVKSIPSTPISNWLNVLESKTGKTCDLKFNKLAQQPLVSLVLVHHNRHQFLKQSIASILAQTYQNVEVIIVDDGSTDPLALSYLRQLSWKYWSSRGWRVLFETNKYLGAARNTGARAATGKYVLFLDDDDFSKPHHVETMIRVAVNTEADVITAGHDVFQGRRQPSTGVSSSRFLPIGGATIVGMLQNVFGDSAMMVRRDYFVSVGGFTEDYGVGFEDYEFLAKASLDGKNIQAIPESLHWYRHHGKSMSTHTNLKTNQLRMLRPYINHNPTASLEQRAVFGAVQQDFFEKYGVAFNENPFARRDNNNGTITVPVSPLVPYVVPCSAYSDYSGNSAIVINEQEVWVGSVKSACWNMGANSPPNAVNPNSVNVNQAIQPVYPDGTAAGYPIVLSMPCGFQYSDVWNLIQVTVAQNTPYNKYKTFDPLMAAGNPSYGYYNRPLVPPSSTVNSQYTSNPPQVQPAWNKGNPIYFLDFGVIAVADSWDSNVEAGEIVEVAGAGPVATDASPLSTGFYMVGQVGTTGIPRYQTGDFRDINELTYPYVTTPVLHMNVPEILNCPFVAAEASPTFPTTHKTFLFGLEPEIATKAAGVQVVLWGMSFTSSSVVYINGVAYTGAINLISSQYLAITLDFTQFSGPTGSVSIYVDDSIPYIVRYYATPATVTGVSASGLSTNVYGQSITVTGQNLPQLSGGFCVFNTTSGNEATPLVVNSATSAQCTLPATAASGVYTVKFAMSVSKYTIPQLSLTQGNYFYYPTLAISGAVPVVSVYAPAPKAIAAQFSNNGASIYVDVDVPATVIDVNQFNNNKKIVVIDATIQQPCAAIFQTAFDGTTTPPTGQLAGSNAGDCFVEQLTGTRFKILLQAQFTAYNPQAIVPNNLVKILSGSLWAAGQALVVPNPSSTVVEPPAIIPNPQVSIVAPLYMPRCSGVILPLDLSATSGSAGRNYTGASSFTFTSSNPQAANSPTSQTLSNILSTCVAEINHAAVCEIPVSMLWSGIGDYNTFTFTLSLTNYLGGVGSQTVTVNVGQDATTPYVTVSGIPQTNAKINQVQVLQALGSPQCGVNTAINYQWSVSGNSCPGLPSSALTGSGSQLIIPAFSLVPETTCALTLKFQYAGSSSWITSSTSFQTANEIIGVSAGSSRTIGASETITVDATFFSDAYNPGTASQYQCAWVCLNSHGFLCSSSITQHLTGCAENVLTGQLALGSYSMKVLVRDTITGVSASSNSFAKLNIVPNSVPNVKITMPSESISPYSNQFSLNAVVDPSSVASVANLKYSWSSCNDPTYASLNFANANSFLTNVASAQVLKFSPGALLGDTTYCMAVTVQDGNNVGTAQITFQTKESPFGGFCFLQSSSIAAVNQPLEYSCPYWAVDPAAQPLAFQFFVRTSASNPWTLVVPTSRSSLMSSTFTTGQYQIKVAVTDEYGSSVQGVATGFAASTEGNGLLQNAEALGCTSNSCLMLKQAIISYNQTGNSADAAKAIGAAALQVNVTSADFPLILELLSEVANDTYVDVKAVGPFLASVLQAVGGSAYGLDTAFMTQFVSLVDFIVKKISQNGLMSSEPACVDNLSAESLFLVLDQTLGSTATAIGLTSDSRLAAITTFNNALKTLSTCFARNMAPQQYPFNFTAGYLTREIGVAYTNQYASFCTFNVNANTTITTDETISYSCGQQTSSGYPATLSSNIGAVDQLIQDLTLQSVSTEADVPVSLVTFALPPSSQFASAYSLTSSQYSNALCSYFNETIGKWSSDGCSVTGVSSTGALQCSCNHLGDFSAAVTQLSSGGLSVGAIIGCVIGALALVLVSAGTIYQVRKQQLAKLAEANGSLLPTSAPPPLAPVLDAPIVQPAPLAEIVVAPSSIVKPATVASTLMGAAAVGAVAAAVTAAAVVAALPAVPPLPSYAKPPSYEYHMQRSGR
ncbi:hypothetical protein HDU98_004496 [Podochytrium sp. JEL0797]|nr:hypothetical protein HDU98_004496 [Podochytrium sp. JEL0797]